LAQILDERAGVVSARIISARSVSETAKALLEQKLTEMTGKKARLSFETDESLLGGIVTQIGSTIYDGSIRNQLTRLREELAG
jgi:F-type H+-transporting ATPase subunit delta